MAQGAVGDSPADAQPAERGIPASHPPPVQEPVRASTVERVTEQAAAAGVEAHVRQGLFSRMSGAILSEHAATIGRRAARADITEIPYSRLGFRIFLAVLALAGVMVLAIAAYAALTYPRLADVQRLLGSEATGLDALKSWRETRAEWATQVASAGQLFLFGSVLPLLGTVVGYLLGEKRAER